MVKYGWNGMTRMTFLMKMLLRLRMTTMTTTTTIMIMLRWRIVVGGYGKMQPDFEKPGLAMADHPSTVR